MNTELLARERTRSRIQEAQQLRYSRRLRALRRASRLEGRAERRMVQAWRRAADIRSTLETAAQSTDRLTHLANQLLSLARVENGARAIAEGGAQLLDLSQLARVNGAKHNLTTAETLYERVLKIQHSKYPANSPPFAPLSIGSARKPDSAIITLERRIHADARRQTQARLNGS